MAQESKLPPITPEAMKTAVPIGEQGDLPPVPQPNLKTGAGMEFPAGAVSPRGSLITERPAPPKMGKSTMGSIYSAGKATVIGAAPAGAAIAAGAAQPELAPVLAPAAYFATKGVIEPKEVAEHPYRTAGETALMGAPAPAESLYDAFPTADRAGKLFESVAQRVGDRPVNMQGAVEAAQHAAELGERGGTTPKVVNDLLRFSENPQMGGPRNLMGWQEGRDFFSSANRLSAAERMATNPPMQRRVTMLADALRQPLRKTAGEVGGLGDYDRATRMYRQAMQMNQAAQWLKQEAIRTLPWGAGTAIGGGLVYKLMKGGAEKP